MYISIFGVLETVAQVYDTKLRRQRHKLYNRVYLGDGETTYTAQLLGSLVDVALGGTNLARCSGSRSINPDVQRTWVNSEAPWRRGVWKDMA